MIWRVIDWNHPDSDTVNKVWQEYVEKLLSSPDPLVQADGLYLLRYSCPTSDECNSLAPRFVTFFENHLVEFFGPDGDAIYSRISPGLGDACRLPEFDSYRLRLLDSFEKLLNDGRPLAKRLVGATWGAVYNGLPPRATDAEGRRLLAAISNYSEAMGENPTDQISSEISAARAWVYRCLPSLLPKPPANALRVSRSWIAAGRSPIKLWSTRLFDADSVLWHNGRLWLSDSIDRKLWKIDPVSLQTELLEGTNRPEPSHDKLVHSGAGGNLHIRSNRPTFSAGKLYLPERGDIWVFSPESNSWASLGLPGAHYSLWNVGEDLFASFGELDSNGERRRGEGAGVYRINTSDDSAKLIFSTRRRPPVHPLDNIDCERPFCIFPDEKLNPIVGLLTKPRSSFRQLGSGEEWKTVDPLTISDITSVSGETLLIDTSYPTGGRHLLRSVQRVNRRGHFEVLLWNPENPAQLPSQPIWKFPDELLKASQRRGSNRYSYRAAMSGDDLYLFVCERDGAPSGTPRNDLYIFRRGQPEAKMLPLAFETSPHFHILHTIPRIWITVIIISTIS